MILIMPSWKGGSSVNPFVSRDSVDIYTRNGPDEVNNNCDGVKKSGFLSLISFLGSSGAS